MPTVTEKIALTREERDKADAEFRKALRRGRGLGMSWLQLATAAGMSVHGVRYLVNNENELRRQERKGETNGQG